MLFPIELNVGNTAVGLHLIFETLAFFIGFRYFLYLRKRKADPITENNRIWIMIGATFGAFLFSRILGTLENPLAIFTVDNPWLYFYSSKTILGGLLGGLLCVEVVKRALGEKESSGDLFTYPLILAMIIGRIGCFTQGINEPTYGVESSLPWAMNLGDGLKRHPVSLYEIVFLVLLWLLLHKLNTRFYLKSGIIFKYFMITYLIFRFSIDFIKPVHHVIFWLSSIQFACLSGLIYYSKTIYLSFFKPKRLLHEQQS
jgi:prolipoprotein diacylglyceryltransferase